MKHPLTALALIGALICGSTMARAQTPPQAHARMGAKQSTIVSWQQTTGAYMCLYGPRVLLFCGTFGPGPARAVINGRSPVAAAAVLHRGDSVKLVNVASGETITIVVLPPLVYLPLMRR